MHADITLFTLLFSNSNNSAAFGAMYRISLAWLCSWSSCSPCQQLWPQQVLGCFCLSLMASPLKGWGCFSSSCFPRTPCLGSAWRRQDLSWMDAHRQMFACCSVPQVFSCVLLPGLQPVLWAAVWAQSEGHRTGLDLLRRHRGKNLLSAELWQRMRRKSCRSLLEAAGQSEEICLGRTRWMRDFV